MTKYFAQDEVEACITECMQYINASKTAYGIYSVRERNTSIYYQNVLANPISPAGSRGELVSMSIPKARKLVRDYIAIIVKQKLKFKTLMKTHSYNNYADMKIADALVDKVKNESKLEEKRDKLAEQAFVLGQSFLWVTWNQDKGKKVLDPVSGMEQASGDADVKVVHPNKVYYNMRMGGNGSWNDLNWVVVESIENKYDLSAKHPEFKDSLEALSFNSNLDNSVGESNLFTMTDANANQELIRVYHFYHKPTPAVPQGRMVIFCDNNIVLHDGENVYESLPVFPCIPETIDDLLLGYPSFSNLVAAQEMLDHNYSVIASNQSAWGLQSMLNPRGSDLTAKQLFGVNFIDYTPVGQDGGGKPEPIQFPRTPEEIFSMVDRYGMTIDNIGGLNSALRGQAPQGVTAASAIATLTANALEFMNSYSRAVHMSITDAMTFAAKLYFMFGAEIQYLDMVDGDVSIQKDFKRDALKDFDRLEIELVNPLLNSYSFNLDSAEKLLAQGLIPDAKTYFRVLEGDRTSIMYDDDLSEQMLIQLENDDLMKGIPCQVLMDDDHKTHILHHKKLLANPKVRREMGPEVLQNILAHIAEHKNFEMQMMQPIPGAPMEGGTPQGPQGNLPQTEPQTAQPAQPAKPEVSL